MRINAERAISGRWTTGLLAVCLAATACGPTAYAPDQPIAMGPWTFRIERTARTETRSRPSNAIKTVFVFVSLENYRERHERTFDDFLNGESPGSNFLTPRMELVDDVGEHFVGIVSPVDRSRSRRGSSMRSARWRARFLLIPTACCSILGSPQPERAGEYLDTEPADFQLVIKNPERRSGQPRRVVIQLE
jgi:hypothetical protein